MEKFWSYIQEKNEPSNAANILRRLYFSSDDKIGDIRAEYDSWSEDDLLAVYEQLADLQVEDDYTITLGDAKLTIVNEAYAQGKAPETIWSKICSRKGTKNFF